MATSKPTNKTRLGFHYFPDSGHYRENDLRTWLPELRAMGAGWLTLEAPVERAIPESFLRGLIAEDVEPILHFRMSTSLPPAAEELRLLLESYADWGVRYVVLFDRPNRRRAWDAADWSQQDLVERFLDLFIPLAESAVRAGLIPVFPPLEPGGDYWDTAFLRTALAGLHRRADRSLLDKLAIGALGQAGNRPLNWGAGGPERWPGARPYVTAPGEEDQCGFRTYDWYLPLMDAVLGSRLPILIFAAGSQIGDQSDPDLPVVDEKAHTSRNLALVKLAEDTPSPGRAEPLEALPEQVICTCFWLLASGDSEAHLDQAWFQANGRTRPIVGAVRQWRADQRTATEQDGPTRSRRLVPSDHIIAHYLLLPVYEWGVADWHLDVVRAFIKDERPTVGFSLVEAAHATRVTVVGGKNEFPDDALEDLRAAGSAVQRIQGDGTTIATILANESSETPQAKKATPTNGHSREQS